MTREQTLAIVDAGDFEQFVGEREDLELEFKGEPYQVQGETARFELAKDACALANGNGGVIVIGVRTERREDSPLDEATEIRSFGPELVDTARYEALIAGRVYPPIQGLRVEFKPSTVDDQRGLVVIDVPPQAETDKLFVILRPISEGESAPGWLVGIAVRSVGRVDVRRPADIHGLINRGFTVTERLDALTEEVGLLRERVGAPPPAPPEETPADRLPTLLDERTHELEQTLAANNESGAYLILTAAPREPTRVLTLTRQDGVRQLLERPPFTRYDGWNLSTLDQARLVGGRRLSVANGKRKHIDLYEDGTLLMFSTLDGFLAWNRRGSPDKLNSLALIELIYNFLLVYDRVLSDLDPLPEEVQVTIGLRHAHPTEERRVFLPYGRIDRMDYELDFVVQEAPDDHVDRSIDLAIVDADPHFDLGVATYQLVLPLYHWFGHTDDAVPYTSRDGDTTKIEIEQITDPDRQG
jgi:hypothetical protein